MDIRTYLQDHILLFDGAMGTYFSSRHPDPHYPCECANLTSPHTIREIHRRYLQSGAKAIRTNTFALGRVDDGGYDPLEMVEAAYRLAQQEVEGTGAYLFCSLGPPPQMGDQTALYEQVLDKFLELGGVHFLFETFSSHKLVCHFAQYIKSKCPEAFVMASFAVDPQGVSATGELAQDLLTDCEGDVDALGFNCICGPHHMNAHIQGAKGLTEKPLSAMANASYPTILGQRVSYHQNPQYFAQQMEGLLDSGAKIVGGCCGTTPEFIRALRKVIAQHSGQPVEETPIQISTSAPAIRQSEFYRKLKSGEKPIAVELDSPLGWDIAPFMKGAAQLKEAGIDLMTIADCPVARARMDSSLVACKVRRELSLPVMPHLTCRDRNLNATKALLLGLSVEAVTDILVVTGDPIPTAQRSEVKAVYEFNSRMLMSHISALNGSAFPSPFYLYGALNINAFNFEVQLELAKKKVERGAMAFFTQPVLSQQGLENLKRAKEGLDVPIVGGILPIVSHRNAMFINNEIPGITVSQDIVDRYEGKTKEECAQIAVEISTHFAREMAPYVDGFYLITPFQRVEIITQLIENIRA